MGASIQGGEPCRSLLLPGAARAIVPKGLNCRASINARSRLGGFVSSSRLSRENSAEEEPNPLHFIKAPMRLFFGVVMSAQRRSNWTPVIVSSRDSQIDGETKNSQADDALCGVPSAFNVTGFDGLSEGTRKLQRRADLHFSIGVALVFALPVFIGFSVYIAAESIILRAG
jgi:hypothetical protein